jgi:integrase
LKLGVACLLAFNALLRVGELVGLRREDVAFQADPGLGLVSAVMSLRLRSTKTGPNQWATVTDPDVASLVRLVVADTSPGDFLFPVSTDVFRKAFKLVCALLGLSSLYVPHSLRHGGATRLALQGLPIEDILLRGRWSSTKSAKRYIQSGRAALLSFDVPADLVELGSLMVNNIYSIFTLSQQHSSE